MQEIQRRILIIDDHVELLFGLAVLLNSVGFEVDTVESGEDGLSRLSESHFDVVVVDYRLPGISGREFIEHVRRQPSTSSLPIIALTASVMKLEECILAGATRGLNKPCKFDKLITELRTVIVESEGAKPSLTPSTNIENRTDADSTPDKSNAVVCRMLTERSAELLP